jgi:hypothetical protein
MPNGAICSFYVAEGSVFYEDTNGATGLLRAGGIEWMRVPGAATNTVPKKPLARATGRNASKRHKET